MEIALGYIRGSKDTQELTLGMQMAKIKAYCALNDLELAGIYGDPGISAKDIKHRPAIQAVLAMMKAKKVQHVVIFKLDRMFRNTIEALEGANLVNAAGGTLHSITEKLDTKSAIGEFFFTLMAALGQMERKLIGERITSIFADKRSRGEKLGGLVPYGYRKYLAGYNKKGEPVWELEPHDEEQAAIYKANSLKAEDPTLSLRGLSKKLKAMGCVDRQGNVFSPVAVKRMISN
jgi:site-specific DNA recombinase